MGKILCKIEVSKLGLIFLNRKKKNVGKIKSYLEEFGLKLITFTNLSNTKFFL